MTDLHSRIAPVRKLVLVGAGLIGGSFALALRRAGMVERVIGIERRAGSLETARQLGIVDHATHDWASALRDADLVMVATPVGQVDAIFAAMAPHLSPGTLITDAGSTKRDVTEAIYRHLDPFLTHVVPAHPIAGAERSGATAAMPDLFDGKQLVMTPLPENDPEAVSRVGTIWQCCGAQVCAMPPADHDRVFAAVSHLPHLLSFGLVHQLASRGNAAQLFSFAASGFRDFTRIAGSHPEMWRDICLANRQALLAELDEYLAELAYLRAVLLEADGARLEQVFAKARSARNAWVELQQARQNLSPESR